MHLLVKLLLLARAHAGRQADNEDGQATAEYALVLLGAAAIALLVVSWATKTNVVGKLLDAVFGELLHRTTATR
jgi:Flp pilus assembly pilin Flp